jgi:ankyrin repeat protein
MNKIKSFLCLSLLLLGATALGMNNLDEQLIKAAYCGNLGEVQRLIREGASVEVKSNEGSTPLMLAARRGYEVVCRLLIEHGALIEVQNDRGGFTPLIFAAWNRHEDVCKLLIDVQLERARKYGAAKTAIATFLGIVRKRCQNLPCQMQKEIAQLIARQALATVQKSKRQVIDQINDIGDLEIKAKWLEYVNQQMNSVNK